MNLTASDIARAARQRRAAGCTCGLIECACEEMKKHKAGCLYLRSLTAPVAFSCTHDRDVCPVCDPCSCASLP